MTDFESINNIDESSLLGYFESITGIFLIKLLLWASITQEKDGKKNLVLPFDASQIITQLKANFNEDIFFEALELGNEELLLNLGEDIVTSAVISSWGAFELILKSLDKGNYATLTGDASVNYEKSIYQFDKREKKDIELFYYVRNAIVHYNGAYHSYRSIDHRYQEINFKSIGNEGIKLIISPLVAYRIVKDLEKYAMKAWANAKNSAKKRP